MSRSSNLTSFDGSNWAKAIRLRTTSERSRTKASSSTSMNSNMMSLRLPENSSNLVCNLISWGQYWKKGLRNSSMERRAKPLAHLSISAVDLFPQFSRHKSSRTLHIWPTSGRTLLFLSASRTSDTNCTNTLSGRPLRPFWTCKISL